MTKKTQSKESQITGKIIGGHHSKNNDDKKRNPKDEYNHMDENEDDNDYEAPGLSEKFTGEYDDYEEQDTNQNKEENKETEVLKREKNGRKNGSEIMNSNEVRQIGRSSDNASYGGSAYRKNSPEDVKGYRPYGNSRKRKSTTKNNTTENSNSEKESDITNSSRPKRKR